LQIVQTELYDEVQPHMDAPLASENPNSPQTIKSVLRFATSANVGICSPLDPELKAYAQSIGLDDASWQFRLELASAIDLCLLSHAFERKRLSEVRKEVLRIEKEAAAIAEVLRRFAQTLTSLGKARLPTLLDLYYAMSVRNLRPIKIEDILEDAVRFQSVAEVAEVRANLLRILDRGGPAKLAAFDTLVRQLAAVYERAMDRKAKVTWSARRNRFEGAFVELVEAVLPKVAKLSKGSGRPLKLPHSKLARGKYIYEMTRAGARDRGNSSHG
jgi:hypothetical protein